MTTSKSKKAMLKHIISSLLTSVKSAVAGNKTSEAVKARVAMTSLVMGRKKKMLQLQLASVCDKINTALGGSSRSHTVDVNDSWEDHRAIVLYNPPYLNGCSGMHPAPGCCCCTNNVDDGVLPEVNNATHSDDDDDYEAAAVQHSLMIINPNEIHEEKNPCQLYAVDVHDDKSCSSTDHFRDHDQMLSNGGSINEEEDIDEVADMFIMRFHKQMRLQKLESFKRYQEMLQRSL